MKSGGGVVVLGVAGARTFTNYDAFCEKMNLAIASWGMPERVVSGGARGADSLARRWCKEHNVPIDEKKPNWERNGRAAALMRNTEIVADATHLIAFPSHTGSGTQDTMRKAEKKGIPQIVYWVDDE
jgi:hypothetical protein